MPKPLRLMRTACLSLALIPGAARAEGCGSGDLPVSFSEFVCSVAVQEAATADPRTWRSLESGDPEPVATTREVPLRDVEWPVVRRLSGPEAAGHELIREKSGADLESLQIRGRDKGLNIRYISRHAPCRTLIESDDASL
ncbi:hypothetical protein [Falsigemmobacter faecalis]|uniref:Uncharacterized protein n=1 Tax=Falsigemmobacter faecalis TaxID=2488730 RepID=A0A3P3DRP6_9RHOB|nr:hypothetical protein [Falsigemmobacter faecalis]RRH76212.1 hypothetical protein EG244_07320 [Falsigemmobacter faecalis]